MYVQGEKKSLSLAIIDTFDLMEIEPAAKFEFQSQKKKFFFCHRISFITMRSQLNGSFEKWQKHCERVRANISGHVDVCSM